MKTSMTLTLAISSALITGTTARNIQARFQRAGQTGSDNDGTWFSVNDMGCFSIDHAVNVQFQDKSDSSHQAVIPGPFCLTSWNEPGCPKDGVPAGHQEFSNFNPAGPWQALSTDPAQKIAEAGSYVFMNTPCSGAFANIPQGQPGPGWGGPVGKRWAA